LRRLASAFHYFTILVLIGLCWQWSFAQPNYELKCGVSASNPPIAQNGSAQNCVNGFSSFLQNHADDMIPQGINRKLKIRTNVLFVQNELGEGCFSKSNAAHMDFWTKIFVDMNARLEQLVQEDCSCTTTPNHYNNIHIELIPTFIELKDDYAWDHNNDPDPNAGTPSVNSYNKPYLNYINSLAEQSSGYQPGFNVMVTSDGQIFNTFVHNNPNNMDIYALGYQSFYGGFWYSAFPTYDLDRPAMLHLPDLYLWYLNGTTHYGGDWWLNTEFTRFTGGGLLHEYGHYFGLVHPDTGCNLNIMRPDKPSRTSLSGCQVRTMYETIMSKNLRKYVICEDVLNFNLEVNSNETWKMNTRVFGDIVVKNGATLIITCQVHLSPNGKIVIERGGKLVLDGGLLTGDCSDKWRGIIVEGDVPGNQLLSGKVVLKNDAIIEYAKDATSMFPSHLNWNNGQQLQFCGGEIEAENSTIRFCNRAVEFMKYGQGGIKDKSFFKKVKFENLKEGVTIWADDGVTFEGCEFSKIDKRGILPYDCEVIVKDGCKFNEQPFGVDEITTYPIVFASKIGKKGTLPNQFNCKKAGVNIQSAGNIEPLTIINNIFNNGDKGIKQNGNGLFDIAHNEFNGQLTSIEFYEGGTQWNIVHENDVVLSYIGSHSHKANSGLKYLGNCFTTDKLVDIFISAGDIFPSQGNADVAAGNCFTKIGIPEIDNDDGTGLIVYFVKNGTPANSCKKPINSTGITLQNSVSEEIPNCGPEFIDGGGIETFCGINTNMSIAQLKTGRNAILQSIANLGTISNTIQQLQSRAYKSCLERVENLIGQKMLHPSSTDINAGKEQAISFFSASDMDFMGKISAYGVMVHQRELIRARNYLNSLTTQNQEEINFIGVQNINLDYLDQPFSYQLSVANKNYLYLIGTLDGSLNGYARSLYEILTGERIEVSLPDYVVERNSVAKVSELLTQVSIFPNPTVNGICKLQINNLLPDKSCHVTMFNSIGISKLQWKFATNGQYKLNIDSLKSGIYFLKIMDDEGVQLRQFKLVVFQ
jgi:Secretion system C-terminal sorting domain/Right handed beta helix region